MISFPAKYIFKSPIGAGPKSALTFIPLLAFALKYLCSAFIINIDFPLLVNSKVFSVVVPTNVSLPLLSILYIANIIGPKLFSLYDFLSLIYLSVCLPKTL